jgi:drug/metabolite transporter (DMT)-like permease
MTASLAQMVVILRHGRTNSMLPATSLSAFPCSIVVWPFGSPGAATGKNFICLALFRMIQFGLGLLLLPMGTRLITAIPSSVIGRLQIPLAPVWVWGWLAFGEEPRFATVVGESIVVAAVL